MLKNRNLTGVLLVFLGAVLFSSKAVFVKLAYTHEIDPIVLLTLRMLFALPFYIIIGILNSRDRSKGKLTGKDWLWVASIGILGYYLASFLDFYGLKYITAGLERLILFVYPTFVIIIGVLFFKEKINRIQIIAIVATYFGILISVISDVNIDQQKDIIIGSILILGSALAFALYLIGSGKIVHKLGSVRFTSISMLVSSFCVLLHYFFSANAFQIFSYKKEVYVLALLIATISTVLPSFMFSEGIKRIGASTASIIGSVGPVSTILLAYLLLDEKLVWPQILGTIIVISGVLLVSVSKTRYP